MKRILLYTCLILGVGLMAYAEDDRIDTWTDPSTSLQWLYSIQSDVLSLGDPGSPNILSAVPTLSVETEGEIVLPPEIEGLPVQGISRRGFYQCAKLTKVTIPSSVRTIGASAFSKCSALKEILFQGDAPTAMNGAFSGTPTNLVIYVDGSSQGWNVEIPGKIQSREIRYIPGTEPPPPNCYGNHTAGKQVYLDDASVENVGYYRFCTVCGEVVDFFPYFTGSGTFEEGGRTWQYKSVTTKTLSIYGVKPAGGDLVIPSQYRGLPVTEIGSFFRNYEHYDSVTIPEGVVSIEGSSFYSSAIKQVKFPSTLKSIGDFAFCGTALTDVEIPASVEEIGYAAFGASDVTNFVVSSENPYFFGKGGSLYRRNPQTLICGDHVESCVVENGTEVMQGDLFYYANTPFLSIPGSVSEIEPSALTETPHLTVVEFRNGVISLDLNMLNNRSRWVENNAFVWRYVPTIKICRAVTDITSDMSKLAHIKYILFDEGDGERVKEMVERAGLDTTNVKFAPHTERTIPQSWADSIHGFLDKYGYDASLTASLPTGKIGLGGQSLTVWDDYVAGTNPVDETSRFTVKIEFDNGKPAVTYDPDFGEKRVYTLYGSPDLKTWVPAEGNLSPYKFFKVSVDLP